MLDANVEKFITIEATIPNNKEPKTKALIVKECVIDAFGNGHIYSQFEEMTFDVLNSNEGLGSIDIQFTFMNNVTKEAYPEFYTKCFVINTDTRLHIKPMKYKNSPICSKINKDGNLCVGIRYYFGNEKEIDKLRKCNEIMVEGFIAIGNKKTVYGIMCQMKKCEGVWKIISANTYKPKYADRIDNLID